MLDRTLAPGFVQPDTFPLIHAEKSSLSNGQELFILRDDKNPVLRFEIIFNRGAWDQELIGQSYFTSKMMQEGTSSHTSGEIAEAISSYGAFLEITGGKDRMAVTVYCLNQFVADVLPIVADIIFQPSFPEHELQKLKGVALQNHQISLEKTSYLAGRQFKSQLFGEAHPYSSGLNESHIEAISVDHLKAFHRDLLLSSQVDYVVTGDVTDKELKLLDQHFGTGTWAPLVPQQKDFSIPQTEAKTTWISKEDSLQASVRIGKLMPKRTNEDFHKFSVANEIFGGYFGSRLMSNIREDKGYTYGISSAYTGHKNGNYLYIATDVKAENAQQTLDEVTKEMLTLHNEPVSLNELETVKNYMLGSFCSSISNIFDQAEKFKLIHYNGLDYSFYDDYVRTIKEITPEEIQAMAKKYLNPDDMDRVVAGG